MRLSEINPFLRYAELQPSVLSGSFLRQAFDFRIFYILEGETTLLLLDKEIPISEGALIFIKPGVPYSFEESVKVIVLNFDLTRARSNQKTPIAPIRYDSTVERGTEVESPRELGDYLIVEDAFETEQMLRECLLHYCYPTRYSDALTSALIKQILCHTAHKSNAEDAELPEIVQKIMLYIQQNYDQDISNMRISGEFAYHSFYLNRLFKRNTGMTIHQAVISERMRIARRLLAETNLTVDEIAAESGFSDRSQFCTAFKKNVGCTPTQYRKSEVPTK
jgi:AraC-like DNA-binding protein